MPVFIRIIFAMMITCVGSLFPLKWWGVYTLSNILSIIVIIVTLVAAIYILFDSVFWGL